MAKSIVYLLAFALTITIIIGINPFHTAFSQPTINDKNLKVGTIFPRVKNSNKYGIFRT